MTEITPSELKLLYIQIIITAIVGVFMLFYTSSPITQTYTGTGVATVGTSSSPSSIPWGTTLVDKTLGLPVGYTAILVISSILLIPMTIMNALTLARLAKDFFTQWV